MISNYSKPRSLGAMLGFLLGSAAVAYLLFAIEVPVEGPVQAISDALVGRDTLATILGLPWTVMIGAVIDYIPGGFFSWSLIAILVNGTLLGYIGGLMLELRWKGQGPG